ncbi:MAG: protein kinase [Tolypothrix brevis GSE-NOS-MK-07-07A]|jgi:serine/threonine protein kinase|nr:protein kinase [Tolypothrix brevis GSE-NOS-MK-07-07A]
MVMENSSHDNTENTNEVTIPEQEMEHQNFFHWQPGQWINDKYLLQEVLGQGGFGITYRATDKNGDSVVIKTLNETIQRSLYFEKLRTTFFNEAVMLNQCRHSHIVRYIEVLLVGDLPCLVMEYIQGKNLAALLRQRQSPLPEAEALRYIQQISEALIVVHNNKLLHRDVKPLNIMIRHNKDEAVLIDFGIARNVEPDVPKEITAFRSGEYAPIEQYQENGQEYGPHTDIYALSATLYTLLTNSYFPDAPTRTREKQDPLRPPKEINPNVSDRVNQAIIKGMERYPEDRPKSIQEWLDLLFDKSGQEFELLLSASLTGFIYGLLTFPFASSLFAVIIWFLILIGLIFVQYLGLLNIIPNRQRYFLTIAVVTAVLVMSFSSLVKEPRTAILILLVSTALGFLSMSFFVYALPYVKTQK